MVTRKGDGKDAANTTIRPVKIYVSKGQPTFSSIIIILVIYFIGTQISEYP